MMRHGAPTALAALADYAHRWLTAAGSDEDTGSYTDYQQVLRAKYTNLFLLFDKLECPTPDNVRDRASLVRRQFWQSRTSRGAADVSAQVDSLGSRLLKAKSSLERTSSNLSEMQEDDDETTKASDPPVGSTSSS